MGLGIDHQLLLVLQKDKNQDIVGILMEEQNATYKIASHTHTHTRTHTINLLWSSL